MNKIPVLSTILTLSFSLSLTFNASAQSRDLTMRTLSCWTAVSHSAGQVVDASSEPRSSVTATNTVVASGYIPETGYKGAFFRVEVEENGTVRAVLTVGKNDLKPKKSYSFVEGVITETQPLKLTTQVDDRFVSVLCKISAPYPDPGL